MTGHDLVTGGCVYVAIGAMVWLILDGLGVIENIFERRAARGAAPSMFHVTLASVAMILAWPRFAWKIAKNPRWFSAMLLKKLSS